MAFAYRVLWTANKTGVASQDTAPVLFLSNPKDWYAIAVRRM